MFSALQQLGLKYDCSWTTLKYTNWFEKPNQGLWPYTLDYGSPQVGGHRGQELCAQEMKD